MHGRLSSAEGFIAQNFIFSSGGGKNKSAMHAFASKNPLTLTVLEASQSRPTLKWLPDLQSTHSPFLHRQTSDLCEHRWHLLSGDLPCGLRLSKLCWRAALAVAPVAGSAFGDAR